MPHGEKNKLAKQQTNKVVVCALFINVILAVLKLVGGALTTSAALIADGLHSLSDMATDLAVLLGSYIGAKKPDKKHPYGHAWAETFATLFISLILIFAGCSFIYKAADSIAAQKISHIGWPVFIIAIISIATKEFAFRITKKTAIKLSSSMLYANAWHHRSDALSSIAVAMGTIASMMNFHYADQFAAIIVGLMIVIVAVKILINSTGQFTARSADAKTRKQIETIISSLPQIRNWHKLRTRIVGRELFMDLHILVDADLTIRQAHDISEHLENNLHSQITQPVNITVHIEPDE